jgi:hypothetical protein
MSLSPLQFRANSVPAVNHNINTNYANANNSHYPGGFGSNVNPVSIAGLKGASSNVMAAMGMVGGLRKRKNLLSRIKNIATKYKKMKGGQKRTLKKLKKLLSLSKRKLASKGRSRKTIRQRGGYNQWGSSIPDTPSYSTGGNLSPSLSALANPVPINWLSRTVNGIDNYNHFTNKGFQLWK